MKCGSPRFRSEALMQLRQEMMNSSIAKERAAAELRPVSHEWRKFFEAKGINMSNTRFSAVDEALFNRHE